MEDRWLDRRRTCLSKRQHSDMGWHVLACEYHEQDLHPKGLDVDEGLLPAIMNV